MPFFSFHTKETSTMNRYESPIDELAERLTGVDASLTTSVSDILGAASQELIRVQLAPAPLVDDQQDRLPSLTAAPWH